MLTAEMCKTIEEIGWGEKWRQEGRKEGRQEGRKEGRQEGRMEGRMEERLENARAMFVEGVSIEKIAHITRFPVDMLKEELAYADR